MHLDRGAPPTALLLLSVSFFFCCAGKSPLYMDVFGCLHREWLASSEMWSVRLVACLHARDRMRSCKICLPAKLRENARFLRSSSSRLNSCSTRGTSGCRPARAGQPYTHALERNTSSLRYPAQMNSICFKNRGNGKLFTAATDALVIHNFSKVILNEIVISEKSTLEKDLEMKLAHGDNTSEVFFHFHSVLT
uniref:Secreted protein n=1 Tax=Oryza alta TaxID=52545 RepID=A0A1V1H136_9ORYZ|nr:hypothetical protein [Oryza alta]